MEQPKKPLHRATYSKDKRTGRYNVRVEGPYPNRFAGREVPVTTKAGDTRTETLGDLVWSDTDDEGKRYALYTKIPKAQTPDDQLEF